MSNQKKKQGDLAYTLRLLSYRPRSIQEIRTALALRDCPPEKTEEIIAYLIRLDYLNDFRFMESWCHFRQHVSPRGRWWVKKELAEKGISPEDIARNFDQMYPQEIEKDCLTRLVEQWLGRREVTGNGQRKEDWRRFYNTLCRKGFNRSFIHEVLNLLQAKYLDIYGKK